MGTTLTPMAKALKAINVIKKDGVNRHSQYKFRGIDGVLDTVGPAFRENGILITSKIDQIDYEDRPTNNGKASTLIRGIVTFRFHFGDGQTLETSVAAEAQDWGDKGTSKFMSVALRTALLQTFTVPTHEKETEASPAVPAAPVSRQDPQPTQTGGGAGMMTGAQHQQLSRLLKQIGANAEKGQEIARYVSGGRVNALAKLDANQAAAAISLCEQQVRRLAAAKQQQQPQVQPTLQEVATGGAAQ